MPAGKILAEVADDEVPYAESWEVIKMKILCARKRDYIHACTCTYITIHALIISGWRWLDTHRVRFFSTLFFRKRWSLRETYEDESSTQYVRTLVDSRLLRSAGRRWTIYYTACCMVPYFREIDVGLWIHGMRMAGETLTRSSWQVDEISPGFASGSWCLNLHKRIPGRPWMQATYSIQ